MTEKLREVRIKVKNITPKQWSNFLIELNLMKQSWKRFSPVIEIKTDHFDKIIKWGQRKPGDPEEAESEINSHSIVNNKSNGSRNKTPNSRT